MNCLRFNSGTLLSFTAFALLLVASGCHSIPTQPGGLPAPMDCGVPREMWKTTLPEYLIEPPDILRIDAIHVVPRPPYHLRTLDTIHVQVWGTLPDAPIANVFLVQPGGLVDLGPRYGAAKVAGMTVPEAETAIRDHLRQFLRDPVVSVSLAAMAAKQQISGEHLVGPDGTVTLGSYGNVSVVGQTVADAKRTIEMHLSQFLENPEVSVDVFAYNSKVYYIIMQGAGMGDGVYRLPVTGNETVLDAISQINGLEQVSSKKIWIARPTNQHGSAQVLPVCWEAITAQGSNDTNYQILPGDRIFVAEDRMVAFDTSLAKLTAPLERVMGFVLLGTGTATRLSGPVLRGGGNPRGNF
jgi:polysaccharide export outer membrane protein